MERDDAACENEACFELVEIHRLALVIIGAGFHRTEESRVIVVSRHQDEVGVTSVLVPRARPLAQLEALHAWHFPVAEDHVCALLLEHMKRLCTARGLATLVTKC